MILNSTAATRVLLAIENGDVDCNRSALPRLLFRKFNAAGNNAVAVADRLIDAEGELPGARAAAMTHRGASGIQRPAFIAGPVLRCRSAASSARQAPQALSGGGGITPCSSS